MKFGIAMFASDYTVDPATAARAVEERGFDSFFIPEHTHIPTSRLTPFPGGGELPSEYSHTLDPFVALTAAATATEQLLIGTGVCLVVERDPLITAKEVATLDQLCGGRFLFGVGAGWNLEEMRDHGTDPKHRFDVLRERVEAMKVIWTEEEAEYHGRHVDFDPLWSWPKPAQKPHPPIFVGGHGPKVLERVVAYGDEWFPNRYPSEDEFLARVAELQELARKAGRDPIPVTLAEAPRDPAELERLAEGGVHRFVSWLPAVESVSELERKLDQRAETMRLASVQG